MQAACQAIIRVQEKQKPRVSLGFHAKTGDLSFLNGEVILIAVADSCDPIDGDGPEGNAAKDFCSGIRQNS
jgi:hypothetical protein